MASSPTYSPSPLPAKKQRTEDAAEDAVREDVALYTEGRESTTATQQLIAFWMHTVDIFVSVASYMSPDDYFSTASVTGVNPTMIQHVGTPSIPAFCGAVREGFLKTIASLPEDVRVPVKGYLQTKIKEVSKHADLYIDDNIVLGDKCFD